MAYRFFVLLLTGALLSSACKKEDDFNEGPFLSKRKSITYFAFENFQPPVVAEIDAFDSTVYAVVPFGTDRSRLVPTIEVSEKAYPSPPSGLINDFRDTTMYLVTAEDGSIQYWPVVVDEGEEQAQLRLRLSSPLWNLSPSGTGVPDFFTTDGERGISYGNGHLYVTNNNDKILVMNPADGQVIGELDMTGVDGGSPKISDVEVSNGQILACNTVEWTSDGGGEPTTFKVYRWRDEDAQPEVFLEYTNTQYRMGDSFTVVGDIETNAVIMTVFGRKFLNPADRGDIVFLWRVTDGVLDTEPQLIQVQGVPTLAKLGSRPHAQMLDVNDESILVNANDIEVTQVDLQGNFEGRLPNLSNQLFDGFTSYFEVFTFLDRKILITAFPRSARESRLIVMDITDGIDSVEPEEVVLSQNLMAGADEIANVNASGAVAFNKVDDNNVEVYVLITNQAIAKFNLSAELE